MLCVRGNKLLYEFANKYKINYKKCGKLIVAGKLSDKLLKIKKQAIENGVECKILNEKLFNEFYNYTLKCFNLELLFF